MMTDSPKLNALQPAIHPAYPRLMLAELQQQDLDPAVLLAGNTVTWAQLLNEKRFVSLEQFRRLALRAIELSGKPWLGLELRGLVQVSAHGPLGYGALSASSVLDALVLIQQLIEARFRVLGFELRIHGETCRIGIHEKLPADELQEFFLCLGTRALLALVETLTGHPLPHLRVGLPFRAPPWADRYRNSLGKTAQINWQQDAPSIEFPAEVLRWPSLTADGDAFRQAKRDCELLTDGRHASGHWPERVRHYLYGQPAPYPTLDVTAAHFHLSPRTLLRRLGEHGVRYQSLLDEVRQELALWHLHHTDLPIERIAERLGFEDTTNFARTCRRWFGATAREMRQGRRYVDLRRS